MDIARPQADVGVIVGRFQVPYLHEAHLDLLKTVASMHPKVIVVLGSSPVITAENPLDYQSRHQMVLASFPDFLVAQIHDTWSDEVWSENLDKLVKSMLAPGQTAILYGSRASFLSHYTGKIVTQELVQSSFVSGTQLRELVKAKTENSPGFRAGVIFGASNRFPHVYPTVDVAIFNESYSRILLAQKPGETLHRFVGGFADPKSDSFEEDARREVHEETGLAITDPIYVGSKTIDDWRYRGTRDRIRTTLFIARKQFGNEQPDDDIAKLDWFDFDPYSMVGDNMVKCPKVVGTHAPLMKMLIEWFQHPDVIVDIKGYRESARTT